MDTTVILLSILIGPLAALAGFFLKYWFDNKSEERKREWELKTRIYTDLSRTLVVDFFADNDQKKMREELHKILPEAYLVAPDFVTEKLKKIFVETASKTGKISLAECKDLIISLRKDLIKDTTVVPDDIFYLSNTVKKEYHN